MTPTELREFVREMTLVKEHELADPILDRFLAEGYTKVNKRRNWEWLLQDLETFTPAGSPFLLDDLAQSPVQAIAELSPLAEPYVPLTAVTRSEYMFLRRTKGIGRYPRVYWVERGRLFMDPEPAATEEFNILYYAIPPWDMLSDAEVPGIPIDSQTQTIGNYAIHRLWERQEDLDKSDAYLGRFEIAVSELIDVENRFNSDGPKIFGQVAVVGGYSNMPWLDGIH